MANDKELIEKAKGIFEVNKDFKYVYCALPKNGTAQIYGEGNHQRTLAIAAAGGSHKDVKIITREGKILDCPAHGEQLPTFGDAETGGKTFTKEEMETILEKAKIGQLSKDELATVREIIKVFKEQNAPAKKAPAKKEAAEAGE